MIPENRGRKHHIGGLLASAHCEKLETHESILLSSAWPESPIESDVIQANTFREDLECAPGRATERPVSDLLHRSASGSRGNFATGFRWIASCRKKSPSSGTYRRYR